ncbi:MAG: SDR family oxidoreductase [Flavobacteriales bacterium]|nr:SDR family oxidoreductase [Flavobacteriales bacterium]
MPQVVMVTGASSGIGKSIAEVLSTAGYIVYGSSRKAHNGDSALGFKMVSLDVTDENSIRSAVDYIIETHGKLDVLVNNAGLGILGPGESVSDLEVREIFNTNFFGLINVCRAVVPIMRKQNSGHIINISSIAAEMGLPFRGIYSASKAAVDRYSEALNMELKPFGVHVSIIQPGDFNTGINDNRKVASFIPDVYKVAYEDARDIIVQEVSHSPSPGPIGKAVLELIREKNPSIRKRVAPLLTRLSPQIKFLLPWNVFSRLIANRYSKGKK